MRSSTERAAALLSSETPASLASLMLHPCDRASSPSTIDSPLAHVHGCVTPVEGHRSHSARRRACQPRAALLALFRRTAPAADREADPDGADRAQETGDDVPEFIFTTRGLRKTLPGGRAVIEGISLSFFYGAKIGVLGHNGAGKSTLLRIMGGLDGDFDGEARLSQGYRVGLLPQEPVLDPDKTVQQVVEEGVAETKALLDRFEQISMKFGEVTSDDEMNALLEEQGKLQDRIDAAGAWELDRTVEIAMDA